jgi:UPF0271 protein
MDNTLKKAVVLDTSALIAGFDPLSIEGEHYTVPKVKDEIAENSMSDVRFKIAVENGKLRVRIPNEISLSKIKASATVVGDTFFLSETDLQVLALALELKTEGYTPLIVTDDYSIQNVANQVGIEFASLATYGIRRRLHWIRYCPACHRKYPADSKQKTCTVCGTPLKRKPVKGKSMNIIQKEPYRETVSNQK